MQNRSYILKVLIVVFILLGGSAMGQDVLLEKKIKLNNQITTLGQALKIISKQGGFTFTYGNKIPVGKQVLLQAGEHTVKQVLDDVLKGIPVDYIEKKDKILIIPRKEETGVTQTVRGRILDKDSGLPIPGVNVYIASPLKGSVTDLDGNFRLEEIPVGRHNLLVSCMGYEGKSIPYLVVHSGKEIVLRFELEESLIDIDEVTIRRELEKIKPLNDMSVISAISLSPEDLNSVPASMDDISRAVLSVPGVVSPNDGQNHIVIRGNSPKGILWRLEGIEVPNMNHFGEIGASGGGINLVSNNMIGRSDFLTGAFPAEYGNAQSGVFDINLRTGNNEKHEQTFQIGIIGTELMVEGPLNQRSGATYIAQFRFYTLGLIHRAGLMENTPEFADLSFKFHLPSRRLGTFSIFSINGRSHETGDSGYDWYNNIGTLGVSNDLGINETTRLKTVAAVSFWKYRWDSQRNIGSSLNPIDYRNQSDVRELTPRLSMTLNKKLSPRHRLRTGIVYTYAHYNTYMGWRSDTLASRALDTNHPLYSSDINYEHIYSDSEGNTGIIQAHMNWRYRIFPTLTLNTGIHYIQLLLNNNNSIEPRVSLSWQFLPKHNLSAGFGVHSRRESFTLYTGEKTMHDGARVQINKDLELAKSLHYIIGYQFKPAPEWLFKTEAYYQHLYDIPVYPFPPYFSTINFDYGFEGNILVNRGTGYNRGLEFTIDRYFSNGYSCLVTGSVYESKYKNYMGEEFPTKYDGSFTGTGMFNKEFQVGPEGRNVLGVGSRFIYTGGFRELPIDLDASIESGNQVRIWDYGFTEKLDNYFRIDLMVYFRRNRVKYSTEWKLELMNLTNNKNMLRREYDNSTRSIRIEYQTTLIPLITYRVQF
ncbi:carboxypeptidase-like regulatory domain-containing protein [Bacteroidota bacterium]